MLFGKHISGGPRRSFARQQPRCALVDTNAVARQARIVIPGQPHHVYLRGNNRRRLFSSGADYERFIACLTLGISASECVLHQLTLMTNHVHLIATPPAVAERCHERHFAGTS